MYNSIKDAENILRENLRRKYSEMLMDTDEEHPMECGIECSFGAFGLSSLYLPTCTSIWQHHSEGWIYFNFDDNSAPMDFDEMPTKELINILKQMS